MDYESAAGNKSRLVPLKTTLEVETRDRVINVYVNTIPVKQASNALR
jgi:tRNA-specific adenosine deaminase 3